MFILAAMLASGAPSVCNGLQYQYEDYNKQLAINGALHENDKDANVNQQATITLGLMRDHHCKMPDGPPSSVEYDMQALKCASALIDNNQSAVNDKCDRSKWTHELPY